MRIKSAILIWVILLMPMIYGCYAKSDAANTSSQGDASVLQEPMFGLDYSLTHDNVHYDSLPPSVLHACLGINSSTFVYAHAKEGSSNYFVVMGPPPDVVGRGDALGGVLQIQRGHCAQWDSTRMFEAAVAGHGYDDQKSCISSMASSDYKICSQADENVLRDLVRDGFVRGARAWGATRFRKNVCNSKLIDANASTPITHEELVRFCHTHP
jgi:hypothetical protein